MLAALLLNYAANQLSTLPAVQHEGTARPRDNPPHFIAALRLEPVGIEILEADHQGRQNSGCTNPDNSLF